MGGGIPWVLPNDTDFNPAFVTTVARDNIAGSEQQISRGTLVDAREGATRMTRHVMLATAIVMATHVVSAAESECSLLVELDPTSS